MTGITVTVIKLPYSVSDAPLWICIGLVLITFARLWDRMPQHASHTYIIEEPPVPVADSDGEEQETQAADG